MNFAQTKVAHDGITYKVWTADDGSQRIYINHADGKAAGYVSVADRTITTAKNFTSSILWTWLIEAGLAPADCNVEQTVAAIFALMGATTPAAAVAPVAVAASEATMTHTKSTCYIARNDYAAVVDGIEIGFSDTAFGAEIICNDYVSAQIELAARAADGAEGATTMTTYTIAAAITSTLAKRMAEVSHVAYSPDAQGEWYAVDTDGDGVLDDVAHAQTARQFNPWHDAAVAIPIEECFDHDGNDFGWGEGINDQFECAARWALDCLLDTVEEDKEFAAYKAGEAALYHEIFG